MASPIVIVSEIYPEIGNLSQVSNNWKVQKIPETVLERKLYTSIDENSLLELVAISDFSSFTELKTWWHQCRDTTGLLINGDFRRQVLEYIDAPKEIPDLLPKTPFIQMRHIEVKLRHYDDYIAWRERTIYNFVRKAEEVELFLAYHSIFSTDPGVMFIAGFSCDTDVFLSVFDSAEYKKIVRQAGQKYIAGGENGLYTKIYRQIDA